MIQKRPPPLHGEGPPKGVLIMGLPVAQQDVEHRGVGPLGWLFRVFILYFVLVFGGGTLMNTNYSMAVEAGKFMQMVTFVEPTIEWAEGRGYHGLARGLKALAGGAPVGKRAS